MPCRITEQVCRAGVRPPPVALGLNDGRGCSVLDRITTVLRELTVADERIGIAIGIDADAVAQETCAIDRRAGTLQQLHADDVVGDVQVLQ